MLTRALLLCAALAAVTGCTEVDPSNPFDPGTPAEQQAAGTVTGALVLPPGFGAARLGDGAVELWRGDAQVARIALTPAADAEPPRAPFAFESVVGGGYLLKADVPGMALSPIGFELAIGESLALGDLALIPAEQDAPRGVRGVAKRAGGPADGHGGIRVDVVDTPYAAVTTAQGDFLLDLAPGSYSLRFSADGLETESVPDVAVVDGYTVVDEVVLAAQPGSVRGQVRIDPAFAGQALLPSVGVTLARLEADGGLTPAGESGAQASPDDPELGSFAFPGLAPGTYQIEARLAGFQSAFSAVEVRPGAATPAGILFLSPAAAEAVIQGRARRDCGDCDHGGIRVEASGTPYVALTNAQGDFRLSVNPGRFSLRYTAPGYGAQVSAPIEAEAGAPAAADPVVLAALPAQLRGTALRIDGAGGRAPAAGATVTVADAEGSQLAAGPVGDDGAIALAVPAAGPATVTVSLDRHVAATRPVVLVPGERGELGELVLDLARGALRGVVAAPGLAQGGTVTVVATGAVGDAVTAGLRQTVTPPPGDGAWRLPNLPAGGWVLTAVAAEHVPSAPRAVQVAPGQTAQVDLSLALRRVQITAPLVVAGEAVAITVGGDADLSHARAWSGATPGAFQPLQANRFDAPLPAADGAVDFQVQAANALAADPERAADPLAYASPPRSLTVIRDTQAPAVWAIDAPALTATAQIPVGLDCRDGLAPSERLTVTVSVDGEVAYAGPYAPRVTVALPAEDGDHTVQATCTDWAGHATLPQVAVVRLDRAGPVVERFEVADGAPNVVVDRPRAAVTLALTDGDAAVATAIEEGALDCANANYRWPAEGRFVVALPEGDGPRQLSLCAVDRAGNTTGPVQSNAFIVDSTAPAPGRLTLGDGSAWTRRATLALRVDAEEAGLRLALEGDVAAAEYPAGEWPAELTLTGADGPKLVSARLIDAAGNSSRAFTDTVTLDRQAPAPGRVVVADGQARVNARLIPVSIAGTNPDTVRFWEGAPDAPCAAVACEAGGFEPFSPATDITLSDGQGPKRVCWQLCDFAGNAAPVGQADLALGTYLPRPVPTLAELSPAVVQAFEAGAQITLRGAGIAADTQVVISDFEVPCDGGAQGCEAGVPGSCAETCTAALPGAVLASAGTYAVSLRTPGPGGGRSDVRFLSVVAPIASVIDLSPRGFTPFDEDGGLVDTVELTVLGYDLLDNTTFRLGPVTGEVVASEPLDLDGVPEGRPQRAVTVRFDAAPLPVPRDGDRLTLSVTNPSPGGGTVQVPVGWNPELADCDVQAGCRSQLDRFRTPSALGAGVAQAYFVDWPTEGGVAWRGGLRARLLREGEPAGLAAVAQAPVEVLPVPQSLGEGVVLEGPPVANPAVDLSTAAWRTSGQLQDVLLFDEVRPPHTNRQVRARDLTGDGWPDLVAAGPEVLTPERVALTLVQGGPDLMVYQAEQTTIALGEGALVALETADVDGDDWPDVVVAMAAEVQLLRGQPGGLAPPLILAHAGPPLVDLTLGDWDGDGRTDGRLVDAEGGLHGLTREADGAIRLRPLAELGPFPVRALEAGDLDGDGVPDLVGVAEPEAQAPALTALLSTRGFQGPITSAAAPVYPHPELQSGEAIGPVLRLGDLDGDGALDAVHNSIGSEVWVYRGLGDGRFERRQTLPRDTNRGDPLTDTRQIHLLDADGDGRLDLFYGASPNFLSFGHGVARGRGDGTFDQADLRTLGLLQTGGAQVHDFDRDGRLDVAYYGQTSRGIAFQPGAGGRPLDRRAAVDCAGADTCGILIPTALTDVSGDGRDDLVFVTGGPNAQQPDRIGVRRQRANGTFEAPRYANVERPLRSRPEPGPWAADGGPAVVVTQRGNPDYVVARVPIAANGTPQPPEPILPGTGRGAGAAFMVPRAAGGGWLVELLRDPSQARVWRYTPATNTAHAPAALVDLPGDGGLLGQHTLTDLDGDGATDLVLPTEGGLVLLRQTAAGLERAGPVFNAPCFDHAAAGDLDGDGHVDLVAGAYVIRQPGALCPPDRPGDGGLTVLWGDGDFGFEAQAIGGLSFHATVADMNGDGLDDIVHTVTSPVGLVGVFLSKPGRQIAPYVARAIDGTSVNGSLTTDLDDDGVLDVLVNRNTDDARGFMVWRRASPITQRLEAGGPQQVSVPAGGQARVDLRSERVYLEDAALTLLLRAAAPVDPDQVSVRLIPPGGDPVVVAGLTADGDRLRLHATDVVPAGWFDDGAWQVEISNASGQAVTLSDARVIAVGGTVRAR